MQTTTTSQRPTQRLLSAQGLTRTYGHGDTAQTVLRGVDFHAAPGEMVAIMGTSGCGKTTLLNCLSGLDKPQSGQVWLGGKEITALKEPKLTRHRARSAGFIFQAYNLIPVLTTEENVMLPLLTQGESETKAKQTAKAVLARLGLAGKERRLPQDLSGGEQQRVAIARALAPRPAVIFADEPTGNLDGERAKDVLVLLRRLNKEHGQTFVIVTHDPRVAAACSRVVHMSNGQVVLRK